MKKLIELLHDDNFSLYNYSIEDLVYSLYGTIPNDPFSTMFFRIYQLHMKADSNLTKMLLILKIKAYANMNKLSLAADVKKYFENTYVKEEDLYTIEEVELMGMKSTSKKLRDDVNIEFNSLIGVLLDIHT